jgi:hypothetical protein
MTRLIDADALTLRSEMVLIRYGKGCLQERLAVRYEDIENAPTIDAVQVIRCKDCKYNDAQQCVACTLIPQMFGKTADNNFCSYAEPKVKK